MYTTWSYIIIIFLNNLALIVVALAKMSFTLAKLCTCHCHCRDCGHKLCWKQLPTGQNSADRAISHNYPIYFIYLQRAPLQKRLAGAEVLGSSSRSGLSSSAGRRALPLLAALKMQQTWWSGVAWRQSHFPFYEATVCSATEQGQLCHYAVFLC